MSEKIIHEVKVIETDEGFRIEINGDKEQIKQMGFMPGMFGFAPWMKKQGRHFGHRRRHRHHRHHRFGRHRGPWGKRWHPPGTQDDHAAEETIKSV